MNRSIGFFGVLLLLFLVSAEDNHGDAKNLEVKHEKDVFILTNKNYHHVVNGHEIVLVLFHVTWDNAYRAILPEFEKAAHKLAEISPSVLLGRLDTSLYPEIAQEVDVRGDAAQFVYYHLGKPYNFEEFVDGDKLIKSLQERSQIMYSPPRPHPELVDELSQHEFEQTLKRTDFAVVAFYRDNCPSCVRLLVEYETAVVNLTDVPKARFFKTNLANADNLIEQYEIWEVPVLKVFRNGKVFDFKGNQKLFSEILQSIKKQLLPPFKEFDAIEKAEGFARSYPTKAAVVGVFEQTSHPNFELFTDVAHYFRDDFNFIRLKKASDQVGGGRPGVFVDGVIAVYPPSRHISPEDKKIFYFDRSTSATFERLTEFIKKRSLPLVGQRTLRNKNTTYSKLPLLIGYMKIDWGKDNNGDTAFHRNKIAQVTGGFKDITFAISDRREFRSELVRFGLEQYDQEVLLGIIGKNGEFYPGPVADMMNLKILTDFATDYSKNKLKPYHRTQSPPTSDDNDDYPVKTVVGATFRKLVLRHDKPVLLLVHRPNCPLCKTALTLINHLSEEKNLYPGLVYAAMDTLANDPPARFTASTYPTLFVVPPNKKENPIAYTGKNYTKAAVMEFMDKHVSNHRIKTEL